MDSEALQERLGRIEEALRALEARVRKLENQPVASLIGAPPPSARAGEGAGAPQRTRSQADFTLVGKSVLVIGGAYVLRALTELGILAEVAGVLLGFVYAVLWIGLADRAYARGKRTVALFDAGTGVLIAASLLWEATTRFHALSVSVACAMIVVASIALLYLARRRQEPVFAVMSTAMASLTCIGLAIGTGDLVWPILAVTLIGVATSGSIYLTLATAVVTDLLAIPLMVITAMQKTPHNIAFVESTLVAIAVLWLVPAIARREAHWPELSQAVAATILGLGGAALFAVQHGHAVAVAAACLVVAVVAYSRRLTIVGAIAAAIGSLLLVRPPTVAFAWAAAGLAAAAIGRRLQWPAMSLQAAFWALAAAVAAVSSGASLAGVAILSSVALWLTSSDMARARFALLAVATGAAILAALAFLPDDSAITRTAILAFAAVALSLASGYLPEGAAIARLLLVVGGVKLLAEDLRVGPAIRIVIALALYGGAMVIVARRRAAVIPIVTQ